MPACGRIRVVVQDHETLDLCGGKEGGGGRESHPGEDGDPALYPGDERRVFSRGELRCPVVLGACNGCSE